MEYFFEGDNADFDYDHWYDFHLPRLSINWDDREEVLRVIRATGCGLKLVSKRLLNDRELAIEAVKHDPVSLSYLPDHFKDDDEIVGTAVEAYSCSIQYASERLRNNKDMFKLIVNENYEDMAYTGSLIRSDRTLMLEMYKMHPWSLQFFTDELRSDPDFLYQCYISNSGGVNKHSLPPYRGNFLEQYENDREY